MCILILIFAYQKIMPMNPFQHIEGELYAIDQKLFSSQYLSIHQIRAHKKRKRKLLRILKQLKE